MYDAAITGDKFAGKATYATTTPFLAKFALVNQRSQY
jgi:hypothetical protein